MTTLVTGATGLLGPYLVDAFVAQDDVVSTSRRGGDASCDLTDAGAVARLIADVKPDVVVHAAAMTDVDACERDPERADLHNRAMVEHLVTSMATDALLVLLSTDQVYPDRPGLHREDDVAPVNVYGATKLAGEQAARRHERTLVLRTNFFGPSRTAGRESLSDFVIDSLRAGRSVTFFGDVLFSPLHVETLSALTATLAQRARTGVYNAGSRDGMSKLDFAFAVAAHLGLSTDSATTGVSTDRPGRAPRPRDLRMAVDRIEAALQSSMPTTHHEVALL